VDYRIRVRRVGPGNRVCLWVDGAQIDGEIIPLPPAGTVRVDINVELGEA
jgi:hypothetical protein